MADASQAVTNFLGGEISPFAQGRFDRPDYKFSLNVCQNYIPVEIGALVRRPGTQYGGHTKGGNKGRVLEFDFEQSSPSSMEFTDGWMRFRNGPTLLTTNDTQTVSAISSANPAVVNTSVNTWVTGNTVLFPPGVPLLENRQFSITQIDTTHFSLQDALTGANIDGSTLSAIPANFTVERVQELQTSYTNGSWGVSTLRQVQAETTTFLLNGVIAPQAVTVSNLPTPTTNAIFDIDPVTFNDGPYLDPFANGAQITPNQTSGIVTFTVSFATYNAAKAYPVGAFVTSSSINYVSLLDQNVGNTPASSPTFWADTSVNAAINNGDGFVGTDIGRLIRLFSEPAPWASGTSYAQGNIVSYNPSSIPGAETYWQALVGSNLGNVPGTDATHWSLLDSAGGAAIWTWGKIVSLSNIIDRTAGTAFGNMTLDGGLAGAFDGVLFKAQSGAAAAQTSGGQIPVNVTFNVFSYVGKNFTGVAKQVEHATVYATTDHGFGSGFYVLTDFSGNTYQLGFLFPVILNLRGKQTAPSSSSDGTLLGTTGELSAVPPSVTIISNDQATSWNYLWIELICSPTPTSGIPGVTHTTSYAFAETIGQVSFYSSTGTSSSSAINVEILGPALPYTNAITTWRLGAFSNTTGFPTCGCYAESGGRLWLGGVIPNRFDACASDGITGTTISFAPTDQFGTVSDNNAISETLNSDGVNQIEWMKSTLEGVVLGTKSGETLIFAPTAGAISPINIDSRRITHHGSANIEPVRTPHAILLVQRYARKILEYFADSFSGKYSAPNLADKAAHITANGISEIAYTEATTPIMWGYDTLGSMFGMTYKRDALMTSQPPNFYGWHSHSLGTGRIVESMCAGASVGGNLDALNMVTNDPTTSIRHVEVLTDIPNETTTFLESWFLDDAVNPTSVAVGSSSMTINGLWHLNGKTVQVFAGGLDLGDIGDLAQPFLPNFSYSQNQYTRGSDLNIYQSSVNKNVGHDPTTDGGVNWTLIGTGLDFVVSNGSITVTYGDGVSAGAGVGLFTQTFASGLALNQIVVGMTYSSDGQIVRPQMPQETGSRRGPALGFISRDHFFGALLVNTLGISFGTNFSSLIPARFTQDDEITSIAPLTTFSGVYTDLPNARYSRNSERLCWRANRVFPASIAAVEVSRATQDQ